ncbi:MAG: glycosyltransferase family 2 protein [Candidatus Omnitrophota bacterium]
MSKNSKTLIIIPALNEARNIERVIDNIKRHVSWADIAVINDGSHDQTAHLAEAKGAIVLNLPYNLGIGGAVQTGYKFAWEMGYDIAVQVDADGQHPASEIHRLIGAIKDDQVDMAIGSRYVENSEQEKSFPRFVGKRVLAHALSMLAGQKITDSSSGFRAANQKVMSVLARRYPRDYPEPESLLMLLRGKFKVKEIPVKMDQRHMGKSSISLRKGIYYVIKALIAALIDMFEEKILREEIEKP